jgi:hypothetical protein
VPDAPYDELGYAADFNQDGKLDSDDISDFVAAYYGGCCWRPPGSDRQSDTLAGRTAPLPASSAR